MISRKTQSKISDIFITLAEAERDVEVTRQVLTENKDYNSYQIFCYLDSDKKNKIDESDIINYLKSNNIFATEIEAKLVILYYDQDLDTNLKFVEVTLYFLVELGKSMRLFKLNIHYHKNYTKGLESWDLLKQMITVSDVISA